MKYLCPYSKLFGEVGKGLHSYRIFDIAYIDVILTMLGAYCIQRYFYPETKYYKILLLTFIAGIIAHRLFCVRTTIDKYLFGK